jgi:hypothetical protein
MGSDDFVSGQASLSETKIPSRGTPTPGPGVALDAATLVQIGTPLALKRSELCRVPSGRRRRPEPGPPGLDWTFPPTPVRSVSCAAALSNVQQAGATRGIPRREEMCVLILRFLCRRRADGELIHTRLSGIYELETDSLVGGVSLCGGQARWALATLFQCCGVAAVESLFRRARPGRTTECV